MTAKSDILPNRSAVSCVRKCTPWRSDAFDSPACRSANSNGTSAMRRFLRARISSRILKPRGVSVSASTTRRSIRKKPGHRIRHVFEPDGEHRPRDRGRRLRDQHARSARETPRRPAAGISRSRPRHRHPRGVKRCQSAGISSGGCCRSPSMTRQASASAAASPASTAPPSPPVRSSRWIRRTGSGADAATRRTSSGVASELSSTKMISASMPSVAAATRRTSSSTLGASLNVGTMMESCTANHRRMRERGPRSAMRKCRAITQPTPAATIEARHPAIAQHPCVRMEW